MNINANETLQYLSNAGIINIEQVQKDVEIMKKNECLKMHKKPIWQGQGKDTRWKTRLPNGKMIAKKRKEDLEKVIIQYYSAPLTFDDLYHHWRKFQDQMVSDNTAYKYDTDYRRYYQDTAFSKMDITKITEENVKVFIRTTVGRLNLCKSACKTLFGYTNNVFKSAMINHYISENPMQYLSPKFFYQYCTEKKKSKDKILVLDKDMVLLCEQLQEDYKNQPEYIPSYAVELAILTGMRVGEIAALTWDSISKDGILINKSEKYNRKTNTYFIDATKNKKERLFPMCNEISNLLDKVKKAELQNGYICEWVFANEDGRVHAPVISSCIKNKCRQLGIEERGIHALRKTFNSKIRNIGVAPTVAATLLGHSVEVNQKYYTFDVTSNDEKKEIVSLINENLPLAK